MRQVNFLRERLLALTENQAATIAISAMSLFILSTILIGQSLFFYVLVLIICGLAIMAYPAVGLYTAFVCTMWFERHFTLQELVWQNASYKLYALDIVLIMTGLSLLYQLYQKKLTWRPSKLDLPIILFVILSFFGFLHGIWIDRDPSLAFSTLKNYALYGIVYVYASLILTTRNEWKQMLRWFAIGGVGLFFFLFYGMYVGEGVWSEYTPLSTVGSRLVAGTHVFYMVLFSFWVLSMHVWRERENEDDPKMLVSILALIIVAIIVSLVRHLWVALFMLVPVWLFFFGQKERRHLWWLMIRGIMLAFFVGLVALWGYALVTGETPDQIGDAARVLKQRVSISSVVNLSDSSFGWRVAAWKGGLDLWQTRPLVGAGFGHMVEGVFDVLPFRVPMRELHNNYLGILIQLGIIGVVIVAYWFLLLLRTIMILWRKMEQLPVFEKRLLFSASSWILLFMIVFSISVYWDINLFIIWWWLALGALRFLSYEVRDKRL